MVFIFYLLYCMLWHMSMNPHQLTSFFFNYPFEILFVACCNYTLHIYFVKFPIELRNYALCSQKPVCCVRCIKHAVKVCPFCSKCKLDIANCIYCWWSCSVSADFWRETCLRFSSCLDITVSPPSDMLYYWQG